MGRLRIVAGRFKGRRLTVPAVVGLRPTAERVREALFDILGHDLGGLDVLDLYAGTGALGFEAASRGARRVVCVESEPALARALRQAAEGLGVSGSVRVIAGRVEDELAGARLGGPFDLVLVDPPYVASGEQALLRRVVARGTLAIGGTLVFERAAREATVDGEGELRLVRTAEYGDTALDFFKFC